MDRTSHARATGTGRTTLQGVALAVGIVFLLVGVAGFIPGITTNYNDLSLAGHQSDAKLIGLFQVSVLHNVVHLLFGVVGVAASRSWTGARRYLVGGGAVYLVLWLYGLLVDKESSANVVPVNAADDWLHLVLGLGMIALGVFGPRRRRRVAGHDEALRRGQLHGDPH